MREECTNAKRVAFAEQTRFVTLVSSAEEEWNARLLIDSLRTFGGRLSHCAVWIFLSDPDSVPCAYADVENVHCVPLARDDGLRYYFANKVLACAQAEEMAGREVRSLIWLSTQCLILNAPVLFDLASSFDAAFRPVHIQNIGASAREPLDDYWSEVYQAVGIDDASWTVESFVDSQELRPYFNSHVFAIDPSQGLCQAWLQLFEEMVADKAFQSGFCRDELHRIFLHQAILSALVTRLLDRDRVRILPPGYSYPLHLHPQVPASLRAQTLNHLVCAVYEGAYRHPDTLNGLQVHEPLRSWLRSRTVLKQPGGNQV